MYLIDDEERGIAGCSRSFPGYVSDRWLDSVQMIFIVVVIVHVVRLVKPHRWAVKTNPQP